MCAPDAPLLLQAGQAIGRLRLADASSLGKKLRRKEKALEQAATQEVRKRCLKPDCCCLLMLCYSRRLRHPSLLMTKTSLATRVAHMFAS